MIELTIAQQWMLKSASLGGVKIDVFDPADVKFLKSLNFIRVRHDGKAFATRAGKGWIAANSYHRRGFDEVA